MGSNLVNLELILKSIESELYKDKVFTTILNLIPSFVSIIDDDLKILWSNKAYLDMLKKSQEEVIGKSFLHLIPKEEISRVVTNLLKLNKQNLSQTHEQLTKIDNHQINQKWTNHAIYEGDFLKYYISIGENIELKDFEKELKEAYLFLGSIMDNIPSPIFYKDLEGRYLGGNKAWLEQIMNLSIEDVVGKKIEDLDKQIPKELAKLYLKQDQKLIAQKGTQKYESKIKYADGTERDSFFVKAVFSDINGNPKGIVGLIFDLEQEKKIQERIIEQEKLSTMGQMASGIAHNFNNLLQIILGYTEICLDENLSSEDITENIKCIQECAHDFANTVSQLQQLGENKTSNEFCEINLNSQIEAIIQQTRPFWKDTAQREGKVIKIQSNLQKVPITYANASNLKVLLINLFKNSIEAMPEGGTLTLKTTSDQKYIYTTITDNGIGMDSITKERLFEPFYSTKEANKGRGLGMSSVQQIVRNHGGEIYVKYSEVGKGTSLEFKIPITQNPSTTQQKKLEDISSSSLKILWVEDEPILQKMFSRQLDRLGISSYKIVGSGNEALLQLQADVYDLVITDLCMPNMNGLELAKKIASQYERKIQVALISGDASSINEKDTTESNISYKLNKPVKTIDLKELFGQVAKTEDNN